MTFRDGGGNVGKLSLVMGLGGGAGNLDAGDEVVPALNNAVPI
jgi:hypothetical protein